MNDVFGIRRLIGPMPFDRDGFHATGREVLMPSLAFEGQNSWYYEYEDWDTVELDTTETDEEYEARCEEYYYGYDREGDDWPDDEVWPNDEEEEDWEYWLSRAEDIGFWETETEWNDAFSSGYVFWRGR